MNGRQTRKYGYGSPERVRVRVETQPPKQRSQPPEQLLVGSKVPVVYYLCRNRHMEHPHFIEVPVSSQEGLFLRDVINRLNVLRGKSMAASHSWSCKRIYKNGFVWHDLSEDDLIVPVNGNEFVLKGTELFESSTSDGCQHPNGAANTSAKLQCPKQELLNEHALPPLNSCNASRGPNEVSTLEAPTVQEEDELSPPMCRTSSSSGNASNSSLGSDGSPILTKNKVCKPKKATNASTQTVDKSDVGRRKGNVGIINHQVAETNLAEGSNSKEGSTMCKEDVSPQSTTPSTPFSNGKVETLESLIRAEARKLNSFRILEEDDVLSSSGPRLKATNVLMQLITCGSLSIKDHRSLGLVHTYKPKFLHTKFPSSVAGSPMTLGERDYIDEKPKIKGQRFEERCFSEFEKVKQGKEDRKILPILANSSSLEAERKCKLLSQVTNKGGTVDSTHAMDLQRTQKPTSARNAKGGNVITPVFEDPRTSFSTTPGCNLPTASTFRSNGKSTPSADVFFETSPSSWMHSFKGNKNILKIEERLPSGARIIIQSRGPCHETETSSSP